MDYCTLKIINNPYMDYYIYMNYYDIDITPIFTDKTTYFNWLPRDLINIIKCYDLYDIKEGDKLYYNILNKYYRVVELSNSINTYLPIRLISYGYLYCNVCCYYTKNIKSMIKTDTIKIYRKRLKPSCNIV